MTVMPGAFLSVDDLGPSKVLEIHERRTGLRAALVVDNVACGPAIGGVRLAPDVTVEECLRLARAMTLKSAMAGLAHGGAKAVIAADPRLPAPEKERLIRAFAAAIRDVGEYVPGPDMGTDERAMGWVHDEIGRAIGLPAELGGIPLDEIGATGLGIAVATEVAAPLAGIALAGARVAVQGFGAVGRHAARFLAARGAVLVAVSDSRGALVDPRGIDVEALAAHKLAGGSVAAFDRRRAAGPEALIGVDCDVWIPAARPDVLTASNVDGLRARIVVQGANIPATPEAEARLRERGVLVVPDFVANAGGLICGAVELRGGTAAAALAAVEEKVRENVRRVLEESARSGALPREVADALARERVRRAEELRRWC